MRLTLPPVRRVLTTALVVPAVTLGVAAGALAGVPASAAPVPATSTVTTSTTATASTVAAASTLAAKPGTTNKAGKKNKNKNKKNKNKNKAKKKSGPAPLVGLRPGSYKGRVKPGSGLTRARITFRVTKDRRLTGVRSGFWTRCDYGFGYRGVEKRFAFVPSAKVGREGRFAGGDSAIDQVVQVTGRLKGRDLTWGFLAFSDTVCARNSPFSARRVGP